MVGCVLPATVHDKNRGVVIQMVWPKSVFAYAYPGVSRASSFGRQ